MKMIHRIATEQFCYVEVEIDNLHSPADIRETHNKLLEAFRPQAGIPDKEFNTFVDAMLLGQSNHIEIWEKLSDKQKDAAQTIKRALKRIEARSGTELRDRLNEE